MKIFAINLQTRQDRLDLLTNTLAKHGYSWHITNVPLTNAHSVIPSSVFQNNTQKVEILRFQRHPSGGLVGCFDSHYAIMKGCTEHLDDQETIMILEDDVEFTPSFTPVIVTKAAQQLQLTDADLATFGIVGMPKGKDGHVSFRLSKHFRGNHAYLMQVSKLRKFVDFCDQTLQGQFHYHIDETLELFFDKKLVTKPFVALQAQSQSDNVWAPGFPLLNNITNTKYFTLMWSLPLLPLTNLITFKHRQEIKKLVRDHRWKQNMLSKE